MNKDVRIGTNYPNHPKIRKLRKELGGDGIAAHVFLLCQTAQYCPSGELKDMDAEDIAHLANWRGDAERFVGTLQRLKLLDKRGDTYSIHNWLRWNLFAASAPKRSEIARENIKKRWDKKVKGSKEPISFDDYKIPETGDEKTEESQVDNTSRSTDGSTDSNTPSPSPSPRREGEGVESSPLGEADSPQKPIDQVLVDELSEIYRGGFIDTTKERWWIHHYKQLTPKEQKGVRRRLKLLNLELPNLDLYEDAGAGGLRKAHRERKAIFTFDKKD